MNATQIKTLRDNGIPEAVIFVIDEITNTNLGDLVTKQNLEITKL